MKYLKKIGICICLLFGLLSICQISYSITRDSLFTIPDDYIEYVHMIFPSIIILILILIFIISAIIYLLKEKRKGVKTLIKDKKIKTIKKITIIISVLFLVMALFLPIKRIHFIGGFAGKNEYQYYSVFNIKIFKKNI